jgi:hypothetical protein
MSEHQRANHGLSALVSHDGAERRAIGARSAAEVPA